MSNSLPHCKTEKPAIAEPGAALTCASLEATVEDLLVEDGDGAGTLP
jgi:hypothetical protein